MDSCGPSVKVRLDFCVRSTLLLGLTETTDLRPVHRDAHKGGNKQWTTDGTKKYDGWAAGKANKCHQLVSLWWTRSTLSGPRLSPSANTLSLQHSEWAGYAAVQAKCGNQSGNELTRNSSGNILSQSSQLAEPLWTDPGLTSGSSVRELIST